jgi:hypothetical protein
VTAGEPSAAAVLDEVIERMIAEHTADTDRVLAARREYEERRGRVFEDDPLWEAWSAAFVEWFVAERVAEAGGLPPLGGSLQAAQAAGEGGERVAALRAWLTSHRSLFEVSALAAGRVELRDLLGGGLFSVAEQRAMHGVEIGDVAELRLLGFAGDVRFGRTFVFHPRGVRDAIVGQARHHLARGTDRRAVIDIVASLRVKVDRYRHLPPSKVYDVGGQRLQG